MLGSALSLNSPTLAAPGVCQHGLSGPSALSSVRTSVLPCRATSHGHTAETWGHQGKLHTDPPARFRLTDESGLRGARRGRASAQRRLPQPQAGRSTHLGPRCPPGGVRRWRHGCLHPKGRALSSRALAGASGPSARSSVLRADWRRLLRTLCGRSGAGSCSNHSPLRGARGAGPLPRPRAPPARRLRLLQGAGRLSRAAQTPGPERAGARVRSEGERASALEKERGRRAGAGRSGEGEGGRRRRMPAVGARRHRPGKPPRLGHLLETQ